MKVHINIILKAVNLDCNVYILYILFLYIINSYSGTNQFAANTFDEDTPWFILITNHLKQHKCFFQNVLHEGNNAITQITNSFLKDKF